MCYFLMDLRHTYAQLEPNICVTPHTYLMLTITIICYYIMPHTPPICTRWHCQSVNFCIHMLKHNHAVYYIDYYITYIRIHIHMRRVREWPHLTAGHVQSTPMWIHVVHSTSAVHKDVRGGEVSSVCAGVG